MMHSATPSSKPVPVAVFLILQAFIGTAAIILLVWELGWPMSQAGARASEWFTWSLVLLALLAEAGIAWKDKRQAPLLRFSILGAVLLLAAARFGLERPLRDWLGDFVAPRTAALIALVVIQLTLVIPFSLRVLRLTRSRFLQQARPGTLFVISFFIAIVGGTLLLKTPNATVAGLSWLDAFFTSTSAICVTGLAVVNTETAFTQEGQFILLALIQIGGLGIMTLTYFIAVIVGQGITLRDQARLGELFSEDNLGTMGHFIGKVVVLTLTIEAVGATLLYYSWADNPPREGRLLWDSVFHSISAFCNAGFSTFADGLADPGTATNHPGLSVIMVLIIAGGLGFAVLHALPGLLLRGFTSLLSRLLPRSRRIARWHQQLPFRLHTRLTLITSASLLIVGVITIFITEHWSLTEAHLWEAVFNSVTARTAGFNISDFGAYDFDTVVLLCALMFIGGSPGGTAGGVKTTTVAIAIGELIRLIRGHQSLHIGNRRIAREVVERSTGTIVLSVLWVALTILLVSWNNPKLNPVDIIFECFSAFGTAGLSRGITAELAPLSKGIIILSMFAGRVGLLMLVLTLVGRTVPRRYDLPDARLPLN
ncbi:MAG: hypothetical protein KDN22_08625 [Verrucomicrobiae bacterium]|nr:hypothetical protein [Verrucomicrobiae bacterium]